jgi:hypothetical protein
MGGGDHSARIKSATKSPRKVLKSSPWAHHFLFLCYWGYAASTRIITMLLLGDDGAYAKEFLSWFGMLASAVDSRSVFR